MNQYRFQKSFAEDARLSDRLFNLLEIVFPEIKISDAALVGRLVHRGKLLLLSSSACMMT